MARVFNIYAKADLTKPVVSGASPLVIPNLTAETAYKEGDYVISAKEDGKEESAKIAVPAFTTTAAEA